MDYTCCNCKSFWIFKPRDSKCKICDYYDEFEESKIVKRCKNCEYVSETKESEHTCDKCGGEYGNWELCEKEAKAMNCSDCKHNSIFRPREKKCDNCNDYNNYQESDITKDCNNCEHVNEDCVGCHNFSKWILKEDKCCTTCKYETNDKDGICRVCNDDCDKWESRENKPEKEEQNCFNCKHSIGNDDDDYNEVCDTCDVCNKWEPEEIKIVQPPPTKSVLNYCNSCKHNNDDDMCNDCVDYELWEGRGEEVPAKSCSNCKHLHDRDRLACCICKKYSQWEKYKEKTEKAQKEKSCESCINLKYHKKYCRFEMAMNLNRDDALLPICTTCQHSYSSLIPCCNCKKGSNWERDNQCNPNPKPTIIKLYITINKVSKRGKRRCRRRGHRN